MKLLTEKINLNLIQNNTLVYLHTAYRNIFICYYVLLNKIRAAHMSKSSHLFASNDDIWRIKGSFQQFQGNDDYHIAVQYTAVENNFIPLSISQNEVYMKILGILLSSLLVIWLSILIIIQLCDSSGYTMFAEGSNLMHSQSDAFKGSRWNRIPLNAFYFKIKHIVSSQTLQITDWQNE